MGGWQQLPAFLLQAPLPCLWPGLLPLGLGLHLSRPSGFTLRSASARLPGDTLCLPVRLSDGTVSLGCSRPTSKRSGEAPGGRQSQGQRRGPAQEEGSGEGQARREDPQGG